jgi:hypothetical protein
VILNDPNDKERVRDAVPDADLILSRGRIHLFNSKDTAIRARLDFANQVWEITLPERNNEVYVELWTVPWVKATTEVHLFVRGRARVKTGNQEVDLSNLGHLGWSSDRPGPLTPETWPELPPWTKPPDRKDPKVEKAMLGLLWWSDQLVPRQDSSVLDVIRTRVEETGAADTIGLLFLVALDAVKPLIGFLKDRQRSEVNGATIYALQSWLSRGSRQTDELGRVLQDAGYARDKVQLIIRLLHFIPKDDLRRQTLEELAGLLDHDELVVRKLALWHLSELTRARLIPVKEAEAIGYDPLADKEPRRLAVEKWKKLITSVKIPSP